MKPTLTDFERMFGGPMDDSAVSAIGHFDWSYEPVLAVKEARVIADLTKRVENRDFSIAGENTERWQKGWQENLDEFRRTGDLAALEPKYLRPAKYLRLNGQFIEPHDPMFERNWYRVFRGWFARRYLSEFDCIYEFGCGSGHNLAFLAQEFPDKFIIGADWCEASVEIASEIGAHLGSPVVGEHFDFFNPPEGGWRFPRRHTAVLTVGALEQTGTRWRPFLDFLHRTRWAEMCFHIEPMLDWYDPASAVDQTAIAIHKARGFWTGFDVTPIRKHRTGFGSLLLEGYSVLQWSPLEAHAEQARIDELEGAP